MKRTLLDRKFCSEEFCDIEEAVMDSIEYASPPIEKDEYGFHKGSFKVIVTYEKGEESDG